MKDLTVTWPTVVITAVLVVGVAVLAALRADPTAVGLYAAAAIGVAAQLRQAAYKRPDGKSERPPALGVLLVAGFSLACAEGCSHAPSPRATAYGVELEECTRRANTLEESLRCEDDVRARFGRPARDGGAR